MSKFESFAATCIAVSFGFVAGASRADLWVAPSPMGSDNNNGSQGAPVRSIQVAVDKAPAEGCVIHLAEGSYYVAPNTTPNQMLLVDKPVQIVADGAREKTILDAELKRRCVWLSAPGASLSGVVVTRGAVSDGNVTTGYGGVRVSTGAIVSNCVIEANSPTFHSCGARIDGGTVTHCIIRNNISGAAAPNGIGAYITAGLLESCDIYGQSRQETHQGAGAGVYATGGVVRDCTIHDNHFGRQGYNNQKDSPTCTSSGGGLYISGTARVSGCTVYGNSVVGYASAVRLAGGTFENSLVYGNVSSNIYSTTSVATGYASGAVHVSGGTMSNCTVTANRALTLSGGVEQTGGKVIDCIVYGNGATDYLHKGGTMTNVITENPGFIDAIAGDYTLPAADAFSCTFTQDVRVVRGDAGGKVKFFASVANAPGDATCVWDFGDGTGGAGETVEHDYAVGVWSVRLTVTAGGQTATCSAKDCVMAYPDKVSVYSGTVPDGATGVATTDIYAALERHPKLIEVHAGTYDVSLSPVWVLEDQVLRGVDGREQVILDAGTANYSRVLVVGNEAAKVEGVKIYRGNTGGSWSGGGGAVIFGGTVSNCWFHLNQAYYSPAFILKGGLLVDSLVTGYKEGGGTSFGGACLVDGGTMAGCTVTAGEGGSIGGATVGGTVYVKGAASVVTNCLIYGNSNGNVSQNGFGGGVYMENGLVVACVISNNAASVKGGGVNIAGGTLRNCLVAGNRVISNGGSSGGGIYQKGGNVENCTVVDNTATVSGGGIYQEAGGTAVNSVFFYNEGGNVTASGSVTYSGMLPLVAGEGNTAAEPAFADRAQGDWRFTSLARDYIDKATPLAWMDGATDLVGNGRVNGEAPDIGAIEYYPSADEPFIVTFSTETVSGSSPVVCDFTASVTKYDVAGCTFEWDFGDGSAPETKTGEAMIRHQYVAAGSFTVTLTVTPPAGAADGPVSVPRPGYVTVIPQVCYVSPKGSNTYPYESWETAATNLPDAVAVGSAKVVVTNGTYSFGSLSLARPIEVVSLEGPEKTILRSTAGGCQLVTVKDDAVRLEGFTLRDTSFNEWTEETGGSGLRLEAGVVSNCIIRDCHRYSYGNVFVCGTGKLLDSRVINNSSGANDSIGVALYVRDEGLVSGCIVTNNWGSMISGTANHGGVGLCLAGGTVTNCVFADNRQKNGGGRVGGVLMLGGLVTHCVISNNTAASFAGGVQQSGGTLRNSLIVGNSCPGAGAGDGVGGLCLVDGTAESLTIAGNSSALPGAGVRQTGGTLLNTVVFGNTGAAELDVSGGTQSHCLTGSALPEGAVACLVGDPQFAEGGYALSPLSPAKDKGEDQPWMDGASDLAGLDRIQGESVDIGAYEVDASIVVPFTAKIEVTSSVKQADGRSRVTLTAVYGGNKGEVDFAWKFGDAEGEGWTPSTSAVVVHDYAPGSYRVALKAHDAGDDAWTEETTATAVALPDTCYVAQGEGVTPVYPYVTPETGAASLKEALAVGTPEIVVCPGTYVVSEVVNIGRAVTVRGQSPDREAATILARDIDGLRAMNVNDPQAVVSGITVSGGRMCNVGGGGGRSVLNLTAGLVTNCVLNGGVNYYGPSVYIENATMVDCVIRNANGSHSVQPSTGLTIGANGIVDRCIITNCVCAAIQDTARGEAVLLSADTAVLRNSLVAYNSGRCAAGVRVEFAAELANCTIVSNVAGVSCAGVHTSGGANRPGVCLNNIVWGNVAPTNPNVDAPTVFTYSCAPGLTSGTGNVSSDPKFRNPSRGDWRLRLSSPCVNAGFNGVLRPGDRDLLGNPRVRGLVPDMGCYENPSDGLMLIVR